MHPSTWIQYFANKQVFEIQSSNESKNIVSKCITKHNEGHSNGNKWTVSIKLGTWKLYYLPYGRHTHHNLWQRGLVFAWPSSNDVETRRLESVPIFHLDIVLCLLRLCLGCLQSYFCLGMVSFIHWVMQILVWRKKSTRIDSGEVFHLLVECGCWGWI